MQISNVVYLFFLGFIGHNISNPIANFVESTSVYEEILPLSVSNPTSYVVFDLFDQLDDYYPLGLTVKLGANNKKEFFVDDLITFGKEIKFVFGDRCISLTSFARNIKLTLTWAYLKYNVDLEYELHGSKITRKYQESKLAMIGEQRKFATIDSYTALSEDTEVPEQPEEQTLSEEDTETVVETSESKAETEGTKETSVQPPDQTPAVVSLDLDEEEDEDEDKEEPEQKTPKAPEPKEPEAFTPGSSGEIDVTKPSLVGAEGYKDSDTVSAGTVDFRCVLFENKDDVYKKLTFKNNKLSLSKNADSFEVCYSEHKTDYYVMVSSQFLSITVEQIYKSTPFGLSALPDFKYFENLKSYPERRLQSEDLTATKTKFELNVDDYEPDDSSFLEKVEFGKCKVYRYTDGLEGEDRIGAVTSLIFGDSGYDIPDIKRFVMASVCKPYLSTTYVTIMTAEQFLYESKVFHSVDGKRYSERRFLEDDDRLGIINLTYKLWQNRRHNGSLKSFDASSSEDVEMLCLNQITSKKKTSSSNCKDIEQLNNFELLHKGNEFSSLVFKLKCPKSSIIMGNVLFDLETDDNDIYIHISHPPREPMTILVSRKNEGSFSLVETSFNSNTYVPITDSMQHLGAKFSKRHVNFGTYTSNSYGITWDYNHYLKQHYLYPSKFPQQCLGDLTFHNLKILSHKNEGYKQISTNDNRKITRVTVTTIFHNKKMVLEVKLDKKSTRVELLKPVTSDEL